MGAEITEGKLSRVVVRHGAERKEKSLHTQWGLSSNAEHHHGGLRENPFLRGKRKGWVEKTAACVERDSLEKT